ncbi:MAG: glycine cleavage system aminomethyltransferase GcvT [Elusimicrobia bacterium]|nr:glycine cleavage system aminomethyltransferase GcvT [Elusimicrobiota bacterium]
MTTTMLKTTALYPLHQALGARMMDFHGWMLPVQYTSILEEHGAVRRAAGLFDISHMGQIEVRGSDALMFLQGLLTNDLSRMADGGSLYTVMCNDHGGLLDDLFVFRLGAARFLLIVNAATQEQDHRWLLTQQQGALEIIRHQHHAALALQGPRAETILKAVLPGGHKLARHAVTELTSQGVPLVLSRTGYTGEDGFEVFGPIPGIVECWRALLKAGEAEGLRPAGLGCRDTLRLEMGYLLYGQDADAHRTPLEAGLGWVVKWEKGEFLGRSALAAQRQRGVKERLTGFQLHERGIPRPGYRLFAAGQPAGEVTSGTFSPCLQRGIGMGYVPLKAATPGTKLTVEIHGHPHPAEVTPLPFYRRPVS